MLINKDRIDKERSVYKCDRCKVQLTNREKIALYIAQPSRCPRKKWDLCEKCYSALVRGIDKKGVKDV